eukprot:TRINITY_DN46797_c0_g1_i1.p1 TRINITY_DN46797_c0_g1~~TRINITY_DN46797_c0_g1_i1.p1  ORF type:complete len:343 (+),score=42.60 TRINITY_DN46797_c0_g1_i1:91-1119(+)
MTDSRFVPSRRAVVGCLAAAAGTAALTFATWWWLKRRLRSDPKQTSIAITKLVVYPVKSCKGCSMREVRLTKEGLSHDREYAIVEVVPGQPCVVMTQRVLPLLAMISPEMRSGKLLLRCPGKPPLTISGDDATDTRITFSSPEWEGEQVSGVDMGSNAAFWLQDALGRENLRLVHFAGQRASPDPEKYGTGATRFSDGFSLLVTSEASLSQMSARSGLAHPTERMRPNIVVDGCDAHAEDTWHSLDWARGGARAHFTLPKPCARCTIPRVDPTTGQIGPDPMRTLKQYRSGKKLAEESLPHKEHYESHRGEIFFGQNANASVQGDVVLTVGDALLVRMPKQP